jgi:hypothetical protein
VRGELFQSHKQRRGDIGLADRIEDQVKRRQLAIFLRRRIVDHIFYPGAFRAGQQGIEGHIAGASAGAQNQQPPRRMADRLDK